MKVRSWMREQTRSCDPRVRETTNTSIPMKHKAVTALAMFYGIFAAAGAVIPWYFNIVWMRESGSLLTPSALVAGGFVTPLTSSLTTDFFIGTTPVVEARRLGMRHSWAYVLGTRRPLDLRCCVQPEGSCSLRASAAGNQRYTRGVGLLRTSSACTVAALRFSKPSFSKMRAV